MTEHTYHRVQARVSSATAEWLADRATRMGTKSSHVQAKIELELWRTALAAELRRIPLTTAEAACLADVLNSPVMAPALSAGPVSHMYAEACEAFRLARETPVPSQASYASQWGIDEQSLLDRLGRLGPTADHALRDAISRWWQHDLPATADGFAAVGINIVDPEERS